MRSRAEASRDDTMSACTAPFQVRLYGMTALHVILACFWPGSRPMARKVEQTPRTRQAPISFVVLQLATWHLQLFFPAFSGSSFLSVQRFFRRSGDLSKGGSMIRDEGPRTALKRTAALRQLGTYNWVPLQLTTWNLKLYLRKEGDLS